MPPSKPTISYSPQSHSLRSRRSMNDLPLSESPSGRRDSTEQLLSKEEEEESEGVTRVNIPQHNSNWYPDEDFELDDENYASIARPPPQRASELLYAFRFVFVFAGVGFGFLILKLVLMKFGHNHGGHHQVAERHYYNGSEWFAPTVIMISLDGFRDDYLDRGVTPNLQQFASEGVSAEYMNPSFPSITFPNHWTLATGLYPESHGIVGNEFYDPELQEMFVHKKPSISTQPKWWKGEPIWATCKNQGRKSAVIMWPGSATPTTVANYLVDYDSTMTAQQKMDIALQWLDMPLEQRPQFIAIYIQQVDQKGHGGGPEGGQLNGILTAMDDAVGKLLEGLKARNLDNQVNVVIVSDHGMAQTHRSRLIYYEDILSKESLSYLREREAWPLLSLRPKDDAPPHAVDQIYNELLNYTQAVDEPHFQVYLRQDIPERYNYRATDRIAPIVAIPDVGYSIVSHKDYDMNSKKPYHPMGIHGYDNLAPEMRAIFMARGPRIEKRYPRGSVVAPFFNVEVYAFVASLLNLDPAPNNGTLNGHFMIQ